MFAKSSLEDTTAHRQGEGLELGLGVILLLKSRKQVEVASHQRYLPVHRYRCKQNKGRIVEGAWLKIQNLSLFCVERRTISIELYRFPDLLRQVSYKLDRILETFLELLSRTHEERILLKVECRHEHVQRYPGTGSSALQSPV